MNRCINMFPASGTSHSIGKDQQGKMPMASGTMSITLRGGSWEALEYTGVTLT